MRWSWCFWSWINWIWLVERDAWNVFLCSHSGICRGYQSKQMNYLQIFFQANILIWRLNITNEKEYKELNNKNSLSTGRVFHFAAVLYDGLFENLTANLFDQVVDIKFNGRKNLDKYTRIYSEKKRLYYFIVFSLINCRRGNAGQTNYSYANSTMERIYEQRQKDNLPIQK